MFIRTALCSNLLYKIFNGTNDVYRYLESLSGVHLVVIMIIYSEYLVWIFPL